MNFVFLSTATHRSLPYQGVLTCGRWGRVYRPLGLFPLLSLHKKWSPEFKMIRYMQLYPTVTHASIFSSSFSAWRMTIRIQNDPLHPTVTHAPISLFCLNLPALHTWSQTQDLYTHISSLEDQINTNDSTVINTVLLLSNPHWSGWSCT